MAMSAQNRPYSNMPEALLYSGQTGADQPGVGNFLDEMLVVVGRGAVAGENAIFGLRRGRHAPRATRDGPG